MILRLFSYAFAAGSVLVLLFCVALGLLRTSQFIESHAASSRRIGIRLLYTSVAVQAAIVVLDSVPLWPLIPSLMAAALHRKSLSNASWPFQPTGRPSTSAPSKLRSLLPLLSLLVLPLASHLMLTRHHNLVSNRWHRHRYDHHARQRLPGGRLDWDVGQVDPPADREMTVLELVAVLGYCVWAVPIWRFLGSCAAVEWTPLPDVGPAGEQQRPRATAVVSMSGRDGQRRER